MDNSTLAPLAQWFASPVGQRVISLENTALEPVLATMFGFHAVQIGCVGGRELLRHCRIPHRHMLTACNDAGLQSGLVMGDAVAWADALPLATDSVDMLLLPHVLEFAAHPHEILREAARILIPEGHVVIIGFNPFSLWGVRGLLSYRRRPPWHGKFMTALRVRDWLALLGFEIVSQKTLLFTPPCYSQRLFQQLNFMERVGGRWWPALGGVYIMAAKKRRATLISIRPRRPVAPQLAVVIRPTAHKSL